MSAFVTPTCSTAVGTAEAVVLPRRHLLALAILMCVPLPALSLAATVVPLPRILERAAATFATLTAPALGGDASVIRESTVAVGSVEIEYEPLERPSTATARAQSQQADGQPARGAPAQRPFAPTKTGADAGGSPAATVDPASEAGDEPVDTGTTGSGDGPTESGEAGTPAAEPGDHAPGPTPKAEPPTSTNPAPNQSGGTGGSKGSGGTGGSKGTGGSGGSGGSKDPGSGSQKPPSGGGAPSDPGSGATPPGAGNGAPGGGSGSPPESPPAGNGGPKSGDRGGP